MDTEPKNCAVDEEYCRKVDEYIATDSPVVFGNYSQAHAACVIQKFLESAKDSVVILSGDFPGDFYQNGILEAIKSAAERLKDKKKVRIITLNGNTDSKLNALHQTGLEYRVGRLRDENKPVSHFMVVDDKRYRLEYPHSRINSEISPVKAEICCNDTERSLLLTSFFSSVWNKLTPVPTR